jgi:LCP family protein required for cell wall assembly
VSTFELEPTEHLPTLSDEELEAGAGAGEPYLEEGPPQRHGSRLGGLLLRFVLLCALAIAGVVAAALLLTPARESVLILGSDARPDEIAQGAAGRTDTLMLFVGDRGQPLVALLSVPRDLWVAIPGYGEERINAAYEFGGSNTAKQTVANVLGQPVNRYVVIGLQGVRDVVNAVGGVDISVPTAIHDASYPTDDYGYQVVDIPAGQQHMDGDTALEYARTRHQDSDFARTARQQQVVAAVRDALLKPINWPRLPAVVGAVSQSIKTDVTPLDAIALGAAMLRSPGDPAHLVIDTTLVRQITGSDGAYLLEPTPDLKPAVARFLSRPGQSGGSQSTPNARVEVLNGAGVSGLAARTADRLTQAGFVVANVGDAPHAQAQTSIVARAGARPTAEQVASLLGVPVGRVSTSASLTGADIQVTLGADAR